jgi:hypothetical protein
MVSISQARRAHCTDIISLFLQRKGSTATAKEILSLHGKLTFVATVLQPARCLLFYLRKQLVGKALKINSPVKRSKVWFRLTKHVKDDLRSWLKILTDWDGAWLLAPEDWRDGTYQTVYSDACPDGQGGYVPQGPWLSAPFSIDDLASAQRENALSLPYLEMLAAQRAVLMLTDVSSPEPRLVRLMSDCLPVVQAVNSGYCQTEGMAVLLREMADWCVAHRVYIYAQHLSSEDNRLADMLSRLRVIDFIQETGAAPRSRRFLRGQSTRLF